MVEAKRIDVPFSTSENCRSLKAILKVEGRARCWWENVAARVNCCVPKDGGGGGAAAKELDAETAAGTLATNACWVGVNQIRGRRARSRKRRENIGIDKPEIVLADRGESRLFSAREFIAEKEKSLVLLNRAT